MQNKIKVLWPVGLFLLALALRWTYLEHMKHSPLFEVPVVDERTYVSQAARMAEGEGLQVPFWQPPLYPLFLGLLYKIFGENYYAFRLIQLAIGALSCLLVYSVGSKVFGRTVGVIGSILASIYGIFIYFEGKLLPTSLSVFLNLALVLSLLWAAGGTSWWRWSASGMLLGLSALAVANVLVFVPLVLVWIWITGAGSRVLRGLSFCAGVVLAIAPVTMVNYIAGHDLVLISSNAGINFYIGNNPDYERTLHIRPGSEWWRLTALPKKEGITRPSLQSRFFFSKALKFIREEPLSYGKLLLKKLFLFWRGDEIKRNEDIYFFRRYSPILKVLLWKYGIAFPFGVIAPLGLLGIALSVRRWREPGVLLALLFLFSYMLSVVLFFVCSRYRVPALPFIILFAGYALYWGYERIRRRCFRAVAYASASLFALLLMANAGVGGMREDGDAQVHYHLAYAYMQKDMYANALVHAERAVAMDPEYFEARYALGALYASKGLYGEAIRHYEKALELDPEHVYARLDLGMLYLRKGEYNKAISECRRAVEMAPNLAEAHYRLGYAYAEAGSLDVAIWEYLKAVELDPSNADYRRELAFAYAERGQYERAAREYEEVLRIHPGDIETRNNLGIVYAEQGMVDKATALFEGILKDCPDCLEARYNLAALYVEQGRYEEALSEYRRIVRQDPGYDEGKVYRYMAALCARMGDIEGAEENLRAYRLGRVEKELRRTFRSMAKTFFRGYFGEGLDSTEGGDARGGSGRQRSEESNLERR